LPRATVGVPGGRYRSVAERVLSHTAVGFVLAILVAVLCELTHQPADPPLSHIGSPLHELVEVGQGATPPRIALRLLGCGLLFG
jgi:hypothetical protein